MRTIYCTSCFRGEGKTTTAVHTSYGLAEFAKRTVLLIDTDGDNPQLHDVFRTGNAVGLAEVLDGTATPENAIVPTQYPQLFLLPAGNGHILHSDRFAQLLDHFKENFEFVVMDGKSLMVSSAPSNLAPLVDVFLLTVECESTKWEVVQMANEKLAAAGATETAVVLNKRQFYVPRFVYKLLSKR